MGVDTNTIAVYGLLITFLSGVIKQFFDSWKEQKLREQDRLDTVQRHQWDREDRMTMSRKVDETAELTRTTNSTVATKLDRLEEGTGKVLEKVAENTNLTVKGIDKAEVAYNAANNFNMKAESLRAEMVRQTQVPVPVPVIAAQTVHISSDDLPVPVVIKKESKEDVKEPANV